MADEQYDAIIVGARIAGAVVAATLGDAGYRVLLIDRATFPSTTLSTHFFRGSYTLSVFRRLEMLDSVLSLGSPPLVQHYWYRHGYPHATIVPNTPEDTEDVDYCLSVRRAPLDYMLVQRACTASTVELLEQTRVTDLLWDNDRVVGVRVATPMGERRAIAHVVVGADGRHSTVARMAGAVFQRVDPPLRALYYQYVSSFPGPDGRRPDGAEFSVIEDEIAYVFPSDAGLTCVALSVNLDAYAQLRKNHAEGFVELVRHHSGIEPRFSAATCESAVLGCGLEQNYVRQPVGPGWALVGDAGLHQDPVTGRGMDMAATHATFLAEALHHWFSNRMSEQDAMQKYHQRRNESGITFYQSTIDLARDLRPLLLT
jgi:menaquinone-9 beta-reductase